MNYPKMLYRKGADILWEGRQLATKIVNDAEAEAKAIADGWRHIEAVLEGALEKAETKVAEVLEDAAAAIKPKRKGK